MLNFISKHFKYSPVRDHLIVAQSIKDPEKVYFYWDPLKDLAPFFLAFRDTLGPEYYAPSIAVTRQVVSDSHPDGYETVTDKDRWDGILWNDRSDKVIKSLAEAFIDLRFASPDRTQIMIQDNLWPEILDEQ